MIIVVSHNKGGAGKTTTAYNLLFELKPDLVLDEDIHRGISVLAGLREGAFPFEIQRSDSPKSLLTVLRGIHDSGKTALVDCGGFDSDITRAAISVADLIIVPSNDTPTERVGLIHFDKTLAEISEKVGRHITAHLLVCKTHFARKNFPKLDEVIERTGHLARLKSVISFRPDHYESHEFGQGVTERLATRHTAAGKEIIALAEEVRTLAAQ